MGEGEDEKMTSRRKNAKEFWKTAGLILKVFALLIFIYNAVLLNIPDIDRSTTGILLLIGICLFVPGLILSHLPQETKNKEEIARARENLNASGKFSAGG
jgi:uncharacterized membrane protein YgdD (TMEM256/DUF423 family)